jgi:hypothetical protein
MCIATTPTTGFCTSPGACNFTAPRATSCETRAPYDFYGSEYCNARATLIVVGTGWCGACQMEAPQIQSQITAPYASRGLRVVSLLTENSDRSPATVDFALRWQTRFGLTSRMVADPGNTINRSVRVTAYPFVAIIDRRGRLRLAEAAPRISRIRSTVDAILAEP